MKTEAVIEHFGTKAAVARALGVSMAAVSQWGEMVPVGRAYQIEVITGGALKASKEQPQAPAA